MEEVRRKVYEKFQIKVNNSSVNCDLLNIKIHITLYVFQPPMDIVKGSPTLWGNTLHVCYTHVLHRDFLTLRSTN
jgi:hypothetical protein